MSGVLKRNVVLGSDCRFAISEVIFRVNWNVKAVGRVSVTNGRSFKNCSHPNDTNRQTDTLGLKPFTLLRCTLNLLCGLHIDSLKAKMLTKKNVPRTG